MGNLATTRTMKDIVNANATIDRAKALLGKGSASFLASALDLYNNDRLLSQCDPVLVMQECFKAAALQLPVQKSLGYAYVVPYKGKPQFQLGYRGLVQLAQRSGQYKEMNTACIYNGMNVTVDPITGHVTCTGEKKSDDVIGYVAYFQLLNGFQKTIYRTKAEIEAFAEQKSSAWKSYDSPWHTDFDAMAMKTVLKHLLIRYGIMSIEFSGVFASDNDVDEQVEAEVSANANVQEVVIPADDVTTVDTVEADDEKAPF